jgi:hypothetical protein
VGREEIESVTQSKRRGMNFVLISVVSQRFVWNTLYENSYAKAFPFGKLIDGMLDLRMIEDTVQLIREALRRERRIAIIINNCAGGNIL